jgi:hypothetical protein
VGSSATVYDLQMDGQDEAVKETTPQKVEAGLAQEDSRANESPSEM